MVFLSTSFSLFSISQIATLMLGIFQVALAQSVENVDTVSVVEGLNDWCRSIYSNNEISHLDQVRVLGEVARLVIARKFKSKSGEQ